MIAHICEQGTKIRREGERLLVCNGQGTKILFSHQLKQVVLYGHVHLTAQARSLLLAKKIDTIFLTAQGAYRGRLVVNEGENVFLRKKQYDLQNDAEFQLRIAKAIVGAKLHNQTSMLGRLKREHHIDAAVHGVDELKRLTQESRSVSDLNSLRGVEGSGAAVYFHHFAHAFHRDWGFSRRVRRPPTDPVNAALSLIYTLLVDRCHTACRIVGLDPFPGNLHALEYGRHSLPLDLVEEFRAIFADSLTLSLFNTRMLKAEDFEPMANADTEDADADEHTGSAPKGIFLKKDALKKVLEAFTKKMKAEFHHPHADKEMTYADAVNWQAREYRRVVEGETDSYQPLLWH